MLRLARFQHDEGGYVPYFYGMASPANAMLIISAAGLIWLQPSSGYGPNLTEWSCGICFGEGEKPYLDFIILPILLVSGGLMISDRKMSKLKSGIPMKLSVVQLTSLLFAILHAMSLTHKDDAGVDLSGTSFTMFLFTVSLFLMLVYIVMGPRLVDLESEQIEQE